MNVLIVSPCFAPDLQVGALRMTSLAGYLCAQGVRVTVLRNLRPENPPYAPPEGMTVACVDLQDIFPTAPAQQGKKRRRNRERAAARAYLAAAREILKGGAFDVMLVSMGPFYTQALCAMAKKEFGVPCVMDFRDPGALDRRKQTGLKKQLWNKLYRAALFFREARAVRAARAVVTVVPGWARLMEKAYHLPRGKARVIANGYDDGKLNALSLDRAGTAPGEGALVIACFGKLSYYSAEYAARFFEAAAKLIAAGNDLRVLQLGQREGDLAGIFQRTGFPESRYENVPFCAYEEGMRRLCGAQVLLAIDERPDAMATKIYDYIYINRPVLFMGPKDTEQARQIGALPGGYAVETSAQAANALREICENHETRLLPEEARAEFGRGAQNALYYGLLREAAQK